MFATVDLIFKIPSVGTVSSLGEQTHATMNVLVKGCLYSPVSSDDRTFPHINHDRTVMRVDLPKEFTASLANASVEIVGRIFKVQGDSGSYMPGNTPGNWNRFVYIVEVSDNA